MTRKVSAGDTCEPKWFKSSSSDGPDGNSRVGIATAPRTIHVRDSKSPAGPRLALASDAWASFVAYASRH
ncbi:DUF397 domain-containing protein [Streptomyces sp. G35A]